MQNWERIAKEQAHNPFYVSWMDGSDLGFAVQEAWCDDVRLHGCEAVSKRHGMDWIQESDEVAVEREVFAVTSRLVAMN